MNAGARALLAAVLAVSPAAASRTVRVRVLERLHPHQVELSGPSRHTLVASASSLLVDGAVVEQPYRLPDAPWQVLVPNETPRRYRGALSVRAVDAELALVVTLPLERYVAEVVAAETLPGTAEEALRAQAVVSRSFLLAQGPRHADADVCDLTHCQLLSGRVTSLAHRAAARAATKATAGRVLVLANGRIAETPFHAACGGHTGEPEEVFGSAVTGAAAVADTGCPSQPWEAVVPFGVFRAALKPLLGAGAALSPEWLHTELGKGGYVVRVSGGQAGRSSSGDVVARALDRALGWGAVRSGRFHFLFEEGGVRVAGSGLGHGLGLCQAGAARRAAQGEGYEEILQHYFPLASLR
ncbi:MAG: SpoIID/LytB domain-containing protein [Myxococcaceae bacterium]